jgi:hypothetical protein
MAVIDAQRLVGFFLADRTDAALPFEHALVVFRRNPVGGLELNPARFLPVTNAFLFPVFRVCEPFVQMAGVVRGKLAFSVFRVFRISLPAPFVTRNRLRCRLNARHKSTHSRSRLARPRRRRCLHDARARAQRRSQIGVRGKARAATPTRPRACRQQVRLGWRRTGSKLPQPTLRRTGERAPSPRRLNTSEAGRGRLGQPHRRPAGLQAHFRLLLIGDSRNVVKHKMR